MRTAAVVLSCAAVLAAGCVDDRGLSRGQVQSPDGGGPGGQVFPALTLQGLRPGADAPEAVSTWEYHDPEGLRYDLLHVTVICMWCPHCDRETTAVVKAGPWRDAHRVAALQIAIQGYSSKAPSWSEVQRWATSHAVDFPVLVDGQGAELGQFFDLGAVPVNIAVDPRTMGVLDVHVGEVGDVQAYESQFLE